MGRGSGRRKDAGKLGSALADTVSAAPLTPVVSQPDTGDEPPSTFLSLFHAIAATPDLAPPLDLRAGELVDGTYRVESKLGAGGMGVVYLAADETLERPVALKIQRPLAGDDGTARLVREAQAMARLAHPNVLSVYEVGTYREHVFIAMAYVDGGTLRDWLTRRERTPREIVDMFAQAGRGLAAAHAAGLIHRDFKPDNVLVTGSGRALVGDFGLARRAGDGEEAPSTGDLPAAASGSGQLRLTAAGACIGTPAYMAPEQHAGAEVDAAADQFSYCVTLYDALYDRLPFSGSSAHELAVSMHAGPPRVRRRRGVPARVRAALARGLSVSPGQRFATMDALVDEIERAVRPRRGLLLAAAALLVVAGGTGAVVWATRAGSDPCADAGREARAIWRQQRVPIEKVFASAGPELTTTEANVTAHLDGYANRLAAASRQVCRQTRASRSELAQRRAECVGERGDELRALVRLLARADRHTAQRSFVLVSKLSSIERCDDTRYLQARVKPPADPAVAASVERLRTRLAATRLKAFAGLAAKGDTAADELLAESEKLGYQPLIAEAQLVRGRLQQAADQFADAEATMRRAFFTAVSSGDDELAAQVAKNMVYLLAGDEVRAHDASTWADQAEAEMARFGGDPGLFAEVLSARALVAETKGDYATALKLRLQTIEALHDADAGDTPGMAQALSSVGVVYDISGDFAKSADYYERALAMLERLLGPEHPMLINVLSNKGLVDDERGEHEQAIAELRRALALAIRYDGPDDLDTAYQHLNLGAALYGANRARDALPELERARKIIAVKLGPDHPDMALVLNTMAVSYAARRDYDKALPTMKKALAIVVAKQGADHPQVAVMRANIADILLRQQQPRPKEALAELEQAIAVQNKAHVEGGLLGLSLTLQGWALVALGQQRRAVAPLERALTLLDAQSGAVEHRGDCRFWLAHALHDLHRGGDRPARLAAEAADLYRKAGDDPAARRAQALARSLGGH